MIHILGVPFDGCGPRIGSALGPAALRLAGLTTALTEIEDAGDVAFDRLPTEIGLRDFNTCLSLCSALQSSVMRSLEGGHMPLVLGGDHSMAIGSVSGALKHTGGDCAVLWIDAHADINTPATTHTGNIHGMPIACLMGHRASATSFSPGQPGAIMAEQWDRLRETAGVTLDPAKMAWIGLRDVDPPEKKAITKLEGAFATTMHDVDRHGLPRIVEAFHEWAVGTGAKNLWISFDVDSLDPVLAPGTGTMVRGGFTYREAHLLAELLAEKLAGGPYKLLGLDVVEVNPILDSHNETAQMAVEWLCSLFGKTILGGYRQHGL